MNQVVVSTTLSIANGSDSTKVADAIAAQVRQYQSAQIDALGAGAINEAIRAIGIAQNHLQSEQIRISYKCQFELQSVEGNERPIMQFHIQAHRQNSFRDW